MGAPFIDNSAAILQNNAVFKGTVTVEGDFTTNGDVIIESAGPQITFRDGALESGINGNSGNIYLDTVNLNRDVIARKGDGSGGFIEGARIDMTDGTMIVTGGVSADNLPQQISTQTVTNQSNVEFTGLSSDYAFYKIVMQDVETSVDNAVLQARTSTDGGASYDSGASDYSHIAQVSIAGTTAYADSADSKINLTTSGSLEGIGTATQENLSGEVTIYNPSGVKHTRISSMTNHTNAAGALSLTQSRGVRLSAADVDALELFLSTGNISGTFILYGYKG